MAIGWALRNADGLGSAVPAFEPHPWLRGGHLQTLAGTYLPSRRFRLPEDHQILPTTHGDRLSVLETRSSRWRVGEPQALLVHGLGGCAQSSYVVRLAVKLVALGVRAVRMNLRGAGSGFGLARSFYHSGQTGDVRVVAEWMAATAPGSPTALVGFSLGGNLVLKLAAEAAVAPLAGFDCVIAANPPLDLAACCAYLQRPAGRAYDRNFVRLLTAAVRRLHATFPDLGPVEFANVATLRDFDEVYTAPRNGFRDAEDYYAQSSSGPLLPRIERPGLVVHAADDPFIPVKIYHAATFPPSVILDLQSHGGHLGYLSRRPWQGDRRWLDARLAVWLATRWGRSAASDASASDASHRPATSNS